MKDGSVMTREYALPLGETPIHSTVALLFELYNQPEALNKRNRFMHLHDDAILGAVMTPAASGYWIENSLNFIRGDYGTVIILEDGLLALTQALRQDAAAGTLGRMREADLHRGYYYNQSDILALIELYLDSGAAGVPTAFSQNHIFDEDSNIICSGLTLTIVVHKDHVNTVRVLKEFGMLEHD